MFKTHNFSETNKNYKLLIEELLKIFFANFRLKSIFVPVACSKKISNFKCQGYWRAHLNPKKFLSTLPLLVRTTPGSPIHWLVVTCMTSLRTCLHGDRCCNGGSFSYIPLTLSITVRYRYVCIYVEEFGFYWSRLW